MSQMAEDPKASRYEVIVRAIQKRIADQVSTPFEIRIWGDRVYRFGTGEPAVSVFVKDQSGLAALGRLDELGICEAYMAGSLDVAGDMLSFVSLRGRLSDRHPLHSLRRRVAPLFVGSGQTNRQAIATHYDHSSEFYLKFMDPTRCYSHALFERDDEALELAQRRKLDFAIDACRLQAGERVLDVGCGWGSFTEHAGQRGIQVTSLTISAESEQYVTDLIQRRRLPCQIRNEDFLHHTASVPYDAIVILGVMEHLPDYPAVLRLCQRLLKAGGRVYLDASG